MKKETRELFDEFKKNLETMKLTIPPDFAEENLSFMNECLGGYDQKEMADYITRNSAIVSKFTEHVDSLQEAFILGFLMAFGISIKIEAIHAFEEKLIADDMMSKLKNMLEGRIHAPINDGQLPS
jgi:hypothetical protein